MKLRLSAFILLLLLPLFSFAHNGVPEYVENKGQWEGPFQYRLVASPTATVFLERGGFTYLLTEALPEAHPHPHGKGEGSLPQTFGAHAYKVRFKGANPNPQLQSKKIQAHYYNYYLGSDSTRWKSGIHPCGAVQYTALYPGIDLYVGSDAGRMKYEFTVAPGASAEPLVLQFEGTNGLSLKEGKLLVKTALGTVTEGEPLAYQYINGVQKKVPCNYALAGKEVRYTFPQGWDKTLPLLIDPTVVFATYTGSTADNWGFTATYDATGNFYAGGIVSKVGSQNYPTSTGAFQTTYGGGSSNAGSGSLYSTFPCDISITKFSATGNTLLYSTYLGGSNNEQPHSMIVDGNNNLILAGRTYSSNYPTTTGSYDGSFNGVSDIIVTKFNAAGTALLASTFVGGAGADGVNITADQPTASSTLHYNYGDDARSEIVIDKSDNVYVTASTRSTDFPTQNAAQATKGTGQDAVVFKLNASLSSLLWSTYFGGAGEEAGYVLTFDTAQNYVYVGGGITSSSNVTLPSGGWLSTYQGGRADGFILRYQNGSTYALQKATYVGTGGYDQVYGLQTDGEDKIYAMGQTLGGTFPVSSGVYSNTGATQFIMKLNLDLSTALFSTVIGSTNAAQPNISPVALLVDTCGNIYLSGWGGTLGGANPFNAGTANMPVTPGAIQTTTDGQDFYFAVLNKNAAQLLYGTYRGGNGLGEHVDGGTSRFDKNGVVYQAICGGCGGSSAFPTTSGAYSTSNGSNNCNLVAIKIAFELGAVQANATPLPGTKGCAPFTVNFQNNSVNAITYNWSFGDGTPGSTTPSPTHTYTQPGTFTAKLVVNNPAACRTTDSQLFSIVIDTARTRARFTVKVTDSCNPYRVQVSNTSQLIPTSTGATYFWNFGDNTTSTLASPGSHNYPDTGTYTIALVVRDPAACNPTDTFRQTVKIQNARVISKFILPDSFCLSANNSVFISQSINASSVLWIFGDGETSTQPNPSHSYTASGSYTVKLIALNPATCNKRDSMQQTVKVQSPPEAAFVFAPIDGEVNIPTTFDNRSSRATSYSWTFGDSTGSTEMNPIHQYKRTGLYTVCLTAFSPTGCADTFCRQVPAEVRVACDVPNAFSPNGDGENDILFVRGGAITSLRFRVFNRWGQLVFESTSLQNGWDGTFNGAPQEADAYAYMLSATFIDGNTFQKNGNVTLLR